MPTTASASSVASQQKVTVAQLTALNNSQLHAQTQKARDEFFVKNLGAQSYAKDVLIPYCEEIIKRYKMQGVAAKDRPNNQPTVEKYFKSIGLNYSTVRSWIHRKTLTTDMFTPESSAKRKGNKSEKDPHLTPLEAKLLGTANAGHDIVKAFKNNGNVDAAIKEFEDHAPTPERLEEYIARPVMVAAPEVEELTLRLCKLIEENDGTHGQDIVALARELRTKLEPTTVHHLLGKETKHHHRKARNKVSSRPEKTALPLPQPRMVSNGAHDDRSCART
jgi:hypothetical protein